MPQLADVPGLTLPVERAGYTNVYWMYVGVGRQAASRSDRDDLILALRERGIDSRPFFHPLDTLPPYRSAAPCPVCPASEPHRAQPAQLAPD